MLLTTTATARALRAATAFGAAALLTAGLAGCSGGSLDGTYLGSSGHTILILAADNTCTYDNRWDEGDELPVLDEDCRWTVSDGTITLNNVPDLSQGDLQGVIDSQGQINLPDQPGWNAEIFTKQ